jgi:hypothetical protein
VDLIGGMTAGRLFTSENRLGSDSFESILHHQDDAQLVRLYRYLHKQCEQVRAWQPMTRLLWPVAAISVGGSGGQDAPKDESGGPFRLATH